VEGVKLLLQGMLLLLALFLLAALIGYVFPPGLCAEGYYLEEIPAGRFEVYRCLPK